MGEQRTVRAGAAGEQGAQQRVLGGQPQGEADTCGCTPPQVIWMPAQFVDDPVHEQLCLTRDEFLAHRLKRREMLMDHGPADARGPGDVRDAELGSALPCRQVVGSVEQSVPQWRTDGPG
ncbi:hypothetical protein GCM10020221_00160 [Streptomyces thioluteus]|uniref:Uncharacterized protein n=1 Tax=Streptomyces thioluteus TaxID=66431 RepID=A0ABP6ISM8_STRTU